MEGRFTSLSRTGVGLLPLAIGSIAKFLREREREIVLKKRGKKQNTGPTQHSPGRERGVDAHPSRVRDWRSYESLHGTKAAPTKPKPRSPQRWGGQRGGDGGGGGLRTRVVARRRRYHQRRWAV